MTEKLQLNGSSVFLTRVLFRKVTICGGIPLSQNFLKMMQPSLLLSALKMDQRDTVSEMYLITEFSHFNPTPKITKCYVIMITYTSVIEESNASSITYDPNLNSCSNFKDT